MLSSTLPPPPTSPTGTANLSPLNFPTLFSAVWKGSRCHPTALLSDASLSLSSRTIARLPPSSSSMSGSRPNPPPTSPPIPVRRGPSIPPSQSFSAHKFAVESQGMSSAPSQITFSEDQSVCASVKAEAALHAESESVVSEPVKNNEQVLSFLKGLAAQRSVEAVWVSYECGVWVAG